MTGLYTETECLLRGTSSVCHVTRGDFRLSEGLIKHADSNVSISHLVSASPVASLHYSDGKPKYRLYIKSNKLENPRSA